MCATPRARDPWSARVRLASQLSIAALLALRLYAALGTVHVVAWDDRFFRYKALEAVPGSSLLGALGAILLPNPTNLDGERSIGYQSWLVLGAKILPAVSPELVWQLVNIAFLLIQVCLVLALARRTTRSRDFSWLCAFLYLSSPIVFGMNRWVMTENHVMTCLLALSAAAFWLLEPAGRLRGRAKASSTLDRRIRWQTDLLAPAATAYLFGICSTLREYAVPSFAALGAAVVLGLLVQRRRLAAMVFAVTLAPFVRAMSLALPPVFRSVLAKSAVRLYYHPMTAWIPHFIVFVSGVAFTLFLGRLALQIGRPTAQRLRQCSALRRPGALGVLVAAHVCLVGLYAGMILFSANRVVRPGIPPLITLLCGLLIATRWLGAGVETRAARVGRFGAALLPLAWAFMIFELFFAYGGGKDYLMHPYPLERYNHPLFLRPLPNEGDMHVIPSKPYWAQDPNDLPPDPFRWF